MRAPADTPTVTMSAEEPAPLDVEFRSDVTVELVKSAAADADVVFAARVSTLGEQTLADVRADASGSAGLIRFLMRERHGSPFEHSTMTFYVQAPIFVWREHMRHRVMSYNEESGRYRVLRPVFYVPGPDRRLVQVGQARGVRVRRRDAGAVRGRRSRDEGVHAAVLRRVPRDARGRGRA